MFISITGVNITVNHSVARNSTDYNFLSHDCGQVLDDDSLDSLFLTSH